MGMPVDNLTELCMCILSNRTIRVVWTYKSRYMAQKIGTTVTRAFIDRWRKWGGWQWHQHLGWAFVKEIWISAQKLAVCCCFISLQFFYNLVTTSRCVSQPLLCISGSKLRVPETVAFCDAIPTYSNNSSCHRALLWKGWVLMLFWISLQEVEAHVAEAAVKPFL